MRRFTFHILLLLTFIPSGYSNGYYQFTAELIEIYDLTHELQLEKATLLLDEIERNDSENLVITYLRDKIEFYDLFISESLERYDLHDDNASDRLDILEAGFVDHPYYLLFQAESHLHTALIDGKFGSWFYAAQHVNKAFKLLKKNEKRFPESMENRRVISALRCAVGTIPKQFQWIVRLLSSLEGSIDEGIKGLTEVHEYGLANRDFVFGEESRILLSICLSHFVNDFEKSESLLKGSRFKPETSPIMTYAMASLLTQLGQNDKVIRLLSNRDFEDGTFSFYYLDYILGLAKLSRNDNDAEKHLRFYITHFKGQNYIKDAYQKLAWIELIRGNQDGYLKFIRAVKSNGASYVDADKQALKEAEDGTAPHPILLQARLLFDGGYYSKAIDELDKFDISHNQNLEHELEYYYRRGRILQAKDAHLNALHFYQLTMEKGKNLPYYYSCNAAFQSGLICEEENRIGTARRFYEMCLSMDPDRYANSIHQKAKAGIERIKGK